MFCKDMKLKECKDTFIPISPIQHIKYTSSETIRSVQGPIKIEYVNDLKQMSKNIVGSSNHGKNGQEFIMHDISLYEVGTRKLEHWKYENEWRYKICPYSEIHGSSGVISLEVASDLPKYIDVPYLCEIEEITLGPTAYMDSTIGSLRVQNKKLANALALFVRCGDYFATTNYDKLLEEVTGLGYYTYNMPGKIVQMLSGQAEMSVIHLHGIYDAATNTDDIVADQKQYEDVIANQGAQFIQNLISTCTLVILGCGATVDDPNLKGFMSFASKQLHLNIPYFYLHKAGDDLSDLEPNVIPVCYGMEYSDLSNAVEDMANYRIRTRYRDSGIIRVNPYVKTRKSFTASYRLHYLNEFCKFVGREKELVSGVFV